VYIGAVIGTRLTAVFCQQLKTTTTTTTTMDTCDVSAGCKCRSFSLSEPTALFRSLSFVVGKQREKERKKRGKRDKENTPRNEFLVMALKFGASENLQCLQCLIL